MKIYLILPTYNEAENLPRLIPQLFRLPLDELNIIVIDDGSPDGTGTIAENIALSDTHVNLKRVLEVISLLKMEGFIENLEHGCHTLIGEGGVNLSGGQKQRIAIARALYQDPQILLLDEPSSSLDKQSEKSMIRAILSLKKEGKTVILVSHRPGILAEADRILIIEKGKLTQDTQEI